MGHSNRTTEGALLFFASLVLLLGFALLFAAKLPILQSERTVNVNTADANQIGDALRISPGLGKLIWEHRQAHGAFPNTDTLSTVRLLTHEQAKALAELHTREDITALSSGRLAAQAGLSNAVAERLVQVLADQGNQQITAARLSRIPVVSASTVRRHDRNLRVRDPGRVIGSYWLHIGLLFVGFIFLHSILRRRAPNADSYILPCALLLCGLGAMVVFSIKDPLREFDVFTGQMWGIFAGLAALIIPLSGWFRSLRPWRYTYVYALAAIVLIVLLTAFGRGPGGAKLKLFAFHPVEIVKLLLVFFVASYLADRWSVLMDRTGPKRSLPLFRDIAPLAVMYLASLATFLLVRDMGPMLLLFGMFVVMLYIATGKPAFVAVGLALVAVTGLIAYKLGLGVFDVRVDMWLSPWANSHPNGMQLGEALWALGTGGIWGSGLGLGAPALMPRSGSDLVFASLGEELGLIGSLGILLILCVLIVRGFKIALHARTDFDRLLAAGVTALLGIQTMVIVYGVLGLAPLTGITLPFVSYGRSSLIASFFIAGLLLNISADGSRRIPDVRPETRRALRGVATGLLVLILGVGGVGRLVWIQGIKADYIAGRTVRTPDADGYTRPHINPRLRAIESRIQRGTIFDRNGRPLATSRPSELEALDLSDDALMRPGRRHYPYGAPLVHLVGYLDSRCGGPVGLEKDQNNTLRGFDDYSALLPIYRLRNTPFQPEIEGKDIRLTIDAELQSAVEEALRKHAGNVRDRRTGERKRKGAAVVLDVYTGEVLAAVSIPNFDPNGLTPGAWKAYNEDTKGDAVLVDRARYGVYVPGSVFKLVTAAAALEGGLGDYSYHCRHQEHNVRWTSDGKTYSRRRITDLETMGAHGQIGLARAISGSCNVYFAHLGIELGAEAFYDMTREFGLRRIAPPKKLVEDMPDNAYGQGTIQVSPLAMARVVAAIANGGVMMKPHFVKEFRLDGEVIESIQPEEMGRPLSRENAALLRKAMADVTTTGTARGLFDGLGVTVAGKTGSAENDQGDRMAHSWFVGFAPVEDPRIAFAVIVENGGFGRSVAGPVCRDIVRAAF